MFGMCTLLRKSLCTPLKSLCHIGVHTPENHPAGAHVDDALRVRGRALWTIFMSTQLQLKGLAIKAYS